MDAIADLTSALGEWRRLTELESEAILGGDWPALAVQQARKAQLQTEIQRSLVLAHATLSALNSTSPEPDLEAVAGELIALEQRNAGHIAARRNRLEAEAQRLSRTLHDLHGVKRAYGSNPGLHWQSYS